MCGAHVLRLSPEDRWFPDAFVARIVIRVACRGERCKELACVSKPQDPRENFKSSPGLIYRDGKAFANGSVSLGGRVLIRKLKPVISLPDRRRRGLRGLSGIIIIAVIARRAVFDLSEIRSSRPPARAYWTAAFRKRACARARCTRKTPLCCGISAGELPREICMRVFIVPASSFLLQRRALYAARGNR